MLRNEVVEGGAQNLSSGAGCDGEEEGGKRVGQAKAMPAASLIVHDGQECQVPMEELGWDLAVMRKIYSGREAAVVGTFT